MNTGIRVLFIGNTAGVFTPVAEWLIDHGIDTKILIARKSDPFGHTIHHPFAIIADTLEEYLCTMVSLIKEFRPTCIHLSDNRRILPIMRFFAPLIPIIFEYHGGELRSPEMQGKPAHIETSLADKIIVSTDDLEAYGEWYDRPISSEFCYRGGRVPGSALMIYVHFVLIDQRELARRYCEENGLTLTILNRDTDTPVPYKDMPEFLSTFEYYFDFKGHIERVLLSKTALEALACGCKVIHDSDPSIVITDATPYVGKNKPEDYLNLYRTTSTSFWDMIRRLPRLLSFIFFRRAGYYDLIAILRCKLTSFGRKI